MEIRILGCSGGIGQGLHTTCLRLDNDILIDAGTGLGELTLSEMAAVRHIFLTHSHLDHIGGIPLMVDSVFERLQQNPVTIHGLRETIQAFRDHIFNWVVWPDFSVLPSAERPVLQFEVMQPGDARVLGDRRLEMIEVSHAVPAVGYHVQGGETAFAFSGDSTTTEGIWKALNERPPVEFLIVECAFPDREYALSQKAYHYCPRLLAEDLRKLSYRPKLLITHLKPGAEAEIVAEIRKQLPDFEVVQLKDGDRLSL